MRNSIDYIRSFVGMENVSVPEEGILADPVYPVQYQSRDEMMSIIYAPDPIHGVPSNDIAMLLKNQDRPEVQAYIQQRLQIAHEHISGSDNPDDAIAAIRGYKENLQEYSERLRKTFAPAVESQVERS